MSYQGFTNETHPENNEGKGRLNINKLLDQVRSLIPVEGDGYFNEIKSVMTTGVGGNGTMFEALAGLCEKYKQELIELRREQKNPEPVYANDLEMAQKNWDLTGQIDALERIVPWLEALPEVLKQ